MTRRHRGADRTARAGGSRGDAIRRMLWVAPLLAMFWLVLSGLLQPLMLALGAVSVGVVCTISWRAGLYRDHGVTLPVALRLPWFLLWLATRVLLSALAVTRKVWSPRPVLRPVVATIPARDLPELLQVIYANTITLTPGTVSLAVGDDRIEVHSLEPAGIEKLREGAMLNRVRRAGARR